MVTEFPSAGEPFKIYWEGQWHELIVRTRQSVVFERDTGDILSMLTIKTISTWLHVWKAIKRETWVIETPSAEQIVADEYKMLSIRSKAEPFVTVFNKDFNGLSITVHSNEDGTGALNAALALFNTRGFISEKMPTLFSPDTQSSAKAVKAFNPPFDDNVVNMLKNGKPAQEAMRYLRNNTSFSDAEIDAYILAVKHWFDAQQKPAKTGQKRNIDDVDSFLNDPATHGVMPPSEAPQSGTSDLPFRFFKRIAPNVIQLQEFKKGGGETYTKSAIEATLPFHKDNPQYDENSLVYYPITGAIQIKEGKFGNQAIIPTAKGRIYIDAEYNGQEKPEWATLSTDLYDQYERLMHDENAQLFAPDCVLVLKNSALTHSAKKNANVQWKNFYHIYQPLKD